MVLAAAMAAVPACSSSTPAPAEPTPAEPAPVYGMAVEEPAPPKNETTTKQTPDAAVPIKATAPKDVDIYGLAPDSE